MATGMLQLVTRRDRREMRMMRMMMRMRMTKRQTDNDARTMRMHKFTDAQG